LALRQSILIAKEGKETMEKRIWHQAYVAGVSPTMNFERITLHEILARTAALYPDHIALIMMGNEITYRQLDADVRRFAAALAGLGIRKGDKVALILPNMPQMVIATYALFRLGAVAVMNNPLYTETELEHNLNDSEARMAICLDFLVPRAVALKQKTRLEMIIACHIREYLPGPGEDPFIQQLYALHMDIEPQEGIYEFGALMAGAVSQSPNVKVDFDDPAAFISTGGTTGVSKAVVLSHANSSVAVQQFKSWLFDTEDGTEKLLAVLPFFHVAGYTDIMNNAIYRGWTAILVPRPTPDIIIEMTSRYKPTLFGGVPTMFVGLLNNPRFVSAKFDSIKGCLSGAAPLALETISEWEKLTGSTIVELYGLTETSALATFNPWRGKTKLGSVGVPVPETDCRIVDIETGAKTLNPGETGEILIKGPQVTLGYYNNPEATADAIKDGWLSTGDIGYLDDEGYLFIVDRKKDVIISGGYNIYPREVDEVLYQHPKVQAACVIGIPDAYWGETVKAYIVLKQGQTATEAEIVHFCKETLAAYKVPKSIEFRTELPQTIVGKILRRTLRDEEIAKKKGP
jgi:long-chain acyl-CoA synthetase